MGQPIPYDNSIVIFLERQLSANFRKEGVRLTRRTPRDGTVFAISLYGGDKTITLDAGEQQEVIRIYLKSDQPSSFYFAFVAKFELAATGKHMLDHASLQVFQELRAGEIAGAFRAEWDADAAHDPRSEHAQPHWHFVQSPQKIASIARNYMLPSTDFVGDSANDIFPGIVDCGRIHFAMTSLRRTTTPPGHKEQFDDEGFRGWFETLTKYVADQIAYATRKSPSRGQAQSFLPR